jgi:hypothetical protein
MQSMHEWENREREKKQSVEERTASFMQKFQDIGSKIKDGKNSKLNSFAGSKEQLNNVTEDDRIIREYREKVEKENALIISNKNKYEQNVQLSVFEHASN